jgi:hypothetical protein
MDATIETTVARDVERELARLVTRAPRVAELPIAPLFDVSDLIRLELALERFAQAHRSGRSKRLVESVRNILGVARTRLHVVHAIRHAVRVAEAHAR